MNWGTILSWALMAAVGSILQSRPAWRAQITPPLLWAAGFAAVGAAAFYSIRALRQRKGAATSAASVPSSPSPLAAPAPCPADGRRHPLYRAVRVALFLFSAGLFVTSLGGIVRHADTLFYAAELQLPKSDAEFKDAILVQLAIATATLDYDSIILQALAEDDIARAEIYANVARRIGFSLKPDTARRLEDATGLWATLRRDGEDALEGAWSGKVESTASLIGAGVADFSGFGDIRDIWNQGGAWLEGKSYDEYLLGLSIFGLAVTVIDPSQVLNTGAAILKSAARLRRVSVSLVRRLRRLVAETVDMGAAKTVVRNPSAAGAARVIRRESLPELRRVATEVGTIYDTGGSRAVLMALRHADDVEELTLFARVSRVMGKQAGEVIEIAGKRLKTVFRVGRLSTHVATVITGWAAALAGAVIGLVTSLSEMIARRLGTGIVLRGLAAYLARRMASAG
ncbi:MAG: hypothetical protein IPK66_17715 [Rhodospirillales bacterium]|nr:hypothetical protein [Rhodospirillales bacterium]